MGIGEVHYSEKPPAVFLDPLGLVPLEASLALPPRLLRELSEEAMRQTSRSKVLSMAIRKERRVAGKGFLGIEKLPPR